MLLAAYCPAFNQCIYTPGSASRSAITDALNLATLSGEVVETYISCLSGNGPTLPPAFTPDR